MHNKTKINTELPQSMGSTLNNISTTTEPPPKNGQQPKPRGGGGGGGLNTFYRRQTFSLETANALVLTYVVLECHTCQTQYGIHYIIFV